MQFSQGYKSNKTGTKKAENKNWYADTFEVLEDYASASLPGTETIVKVVGIRKKEDGSEHISIEKWNQDGRFIKALQFPALRTVPGLLYDALKAMGAIPSDTPFTLGQQGTAAKSGSRRTRPV